MSNIFEEWPKTTRLYSPVVISEKIDGTNSAFVVNDDLTFFCQSRNRIITPDNDNQGFARWCYDNADSLVEDLHIGRHFGEWWGFGIQRGYNLTKGDKRFSLFNTRRWAPTEENPFKTKNLATVPVIYEGDYSEGLIPSIQNELVKMGSHASPGFMNVEGIVIFFKNNNICMKHPFGK